MDSYLTMHDPIPQIVVNDTDTRELGFAYKQTVARLLYCHDSLDKIAALPSNQEE